MNAFELNKIASMVLTAALIIFGGKTFLEIKEAPRKIERAGFTLPVPTGGATGGPAAAAAAYDPKGVLSLLAKASVDGGKDAFRKCTSCHTVDKGGPSKVGPNLFGVVDREVGHHEGFAFSPALKAKGGKWDYAHLAEYLHNPRAAIPGNRMAFPGIADDAELADLIAYLRTLSDSPAALPN